MAIDLFVRGIPSGAHSAEISAHFGASKVKEVIIPKDPRGVQRGFAFVRFENRDDAEAALKLFNGSEFKGKNLRIEFRRPSIRSRRGSAQKDGRVTSMQPRTYAPVDQWNNKQESGSTIGVRISPAESSGRLYLCDGSFPSTASGQSVTTLPLASTATRQKQLPDVIGSLVAPLAAYTRSLDSLMRESPPQASRIRSEIERIARFFAQTFYNSLSEGEIIETKLRRRLAAGGTLLRASAGQAIIFADDLGSACGACRYEFIKRGVRWWIQNRSLFWDLTEHGNEAGHLSTHGFDSKLGKLLPAMAEALIQLDELQWVLLVDQGDRSSVSLNGPDSEHWQPYTGCVPANRIAMEPFLIFRAQEKRLDAFQDQDSEDLYTYTRLGESVSPPEDFKLFRADDRLSKLIEKHCPVRKWKHELTQWKQLAASSRALSNEGYDFADLVREVPRILYGREDLFPSLTRRIFENTTSKTGIVLVVGPQGMGKSALMWKLQEHSLAIRRQFVWYCFRDNDRRCDIDSFFRAAALKIASDKEISLVAESSQARFEEALSSQAADPRSVGRTPILLLDGLDALGAKPTPDLKRLLDTMETTSHSALWVCSSQLLLEVRSFADRNASVVTLYDVPFLSRHAARQFLRDELRANSSRFSETDLLYLTSDAWIEQIVAKPDAGLPLYVRHVLDSAIAKDYRDPDKIPPTLAEAWERTIGRLKQDLIAIKVLAVLSVALGPLKSDEIAQILGCLDLETIETTLRRHPSFADVEAGWFISYAAFRQYLCESSATDLLLYRKEASSNLIAWANRWKIHESRYSFEFLPRHFEEEDHQSLRRLALDSDFLTAQAKRFPHRPDLPLETIYRALKSAAHDSLIHEVFNFALRHAEYVASTSTIARLSSEFYQRNSLHLSQLASLLPEEQEQNIWKLVAIMAALADRDRKCAEEIATDIGRRRRERGSQKKYERPVAVLLAIVTSTAAQLNIDIEQSLYRIARSVLSGTGQNLFFKSLGALHSHEVISSLLPTHTSNREAVKDVARVLGRQHQLESISKLLKLCDRQLDSEIRFEGAKGLSATGNVDSALTVASQIGNHSLRRAGLCRVASDTAMSYRADIRLVQALVATQQFWNKPAEEKGQWAFRMPTLSGEAEGEAEKTVRTVISSILECASGVTAPLPAAGITAEIGIVQAKIFGDSSGLCRAEAIAEEVVGARLSVIEAYVRLKRWSDARRMCESMHGTIRSRIDADICAAELLDHREDLTQDSTLQQRSIQRACDLSSALTRAGDPEAGFKVLFQILPRLHSLKAEQPSLWGRPRVLGEIVGALYALGKSELADRYFGSTYNSLKALRGIGWESDRAFAFLNFAEALLSGTDSRLPTDLKERIDNLLREASRVAKDGLRRWPETLAGILAEIWELRKRYDLFCNASSDLSDAFLLARNSPNVRLRLAALAEIARNQAKSVNPDDAYKTLAEVEVISSQCGPLEQARVLLTRSLCGQVTGLQPAIENALRCFHGDALNVVRRAEVEFHLQVSNMKAAEESLDKIDDVEVRAHASRDLAIKYATQGNLDSALSVTQREIGASRSELIPDVAEVIAKHTRSGVLSRIDGGQALLQLLTETARYLDGTFRVIAAIINSRAFDLGDERLECLAELLVIDQSRQESLQVSAN